MYIACSTINGRNRFFIRESFLENEIYYSRDLMELGENPGKFIIYANHMAFYIDESVEDHLSAAGMNVSQDELEDLFWPYLRPDVKYRFRYARSRSKKETAGNTASHHFHMFDRRRLHFLRFGQMNQKRIFNVSPKMFQVLNEKSRDELEQYFILNEKKLKPKEFKSYVYVIFDLQNHFGKTFATEMPQVLDQSEVDAHFLDDICRLNCDKKFWAGMEMTGWLHEYLKRYIILFFDSAYAETRYFDEKRYDWINSKRAYKPFPFKTKEKMYQEASTIFGMPTNDLKKMSKKDLTKLYRKKARALHPDGGGSHDEFIHLSEVYDALVEGKDG